MIHMIHGHSFFLIRNWHDKQNFVFVLNLEQGDEYDFCK